jgi:hypothetical protein
MLYKRVMAWLSVRHLERRIALIAPLFALPSLPIGLQADDHLLRDQLMKGGPIAAYVFTARGAQASHAQALEQRTAEYAPWWNDEHLHARCFRPLSSLSLWLEFAQGAPPWWMHLENRPRIMVRDRFFLPAITGAISAASCGSDPTRPFEAAARLSTWLARGRGKSPSSMIPIVLDLTFAAAPRRDGFGGPCKAVGSIKLATRPRDVQRSI